MLWNVRAHREHYEPIANQLTHLVALFAFAAAPAIAANQALDYSHQIYTDRYALLCEKVALELSGSATLFLLHHSEEEEARLGCQEVQGSVPVYHVRPLPKNSPDDVTVVELSIYPNLPANWVTTPPNLRNDVPRPGR